MKAKLRLIGNAIKTFWWVIVLVVVAVFLGWLYLVQRRGNYSETNGKTKRTIMNSVVEKVQGAATDVRVERAIIGAETKMMREALEKVRKEPDGKKRREKLANMLQKSL